jgi:hypothetical protein
VSSPRRSNDRRFTGPASRNFDCASRTRFPERSSRTSESGRGSQTRALVSYTAPRRLGRPLRCASLVCSLHFVPLVRPLLDADLRRPVVKQHAPWHISRRAGRARVGGVSPPSFAVPPEIGSRAAKMLPCGGRNDAARSLPVSVRPLGALLADPVMTGGGCDESGNLNGAATLVPRDAASRRSRPVENPGGRSRAN